jgi:hypothetical protein
MNQPHRPVLADSDTRLLAFDAAAADALPRLHVRHLGSIHASTSFLEASRKAPFPTEQLLCQQKGGR